MPWTEPRKTCPLCEGDKQVDKEPREEEVDSNGDIWIIQVRCYWCRGLGYMKGDESVKA